MAILLMLAMVATHFVAFAPMQPSYAVAGDEGLKLSVPSITITGVTEGAYYNTNVTPTVTVTDAVSTSAFLNGAAYSTGTAISTEGEYTLLVVAENAEGNTSSEQASFTIDKTAPTVVIFMNPSRSDGLNHWYVTRPTITAIAYTDKVNKVIDSDASITYSYNPGAVTGTYTEPLTIEADGFFEISASATDLAGNIGTVASSITYKVDTIFPFVTIDALPEITSSSTLTVSGIATDTNVSNDNHGSSQVFLNGTGGQISLIESGSYNKTVELTSQGANEIYVRVKDNAGNVATTSAQTVVFDSVAPVAPSITAAPHTETSGTVSVSLPAIEDGASAYISTDGVNFSLYSEAVAVSVNNTTITAYQIDAAGNQGANTTLLIDWIDKEAPAKPTISTEAQTLDAGSITIEGTAEAGSTVTITGGAQAATGTSDTSTGAYSISVSLTQDSANTLLVTATDAAGNESGATSVVITEDSTGPVITLNGDAITTVEALSAYVDAGATATDLVDGEVDVTSTSSVDTSALGIYTVTYSAADLSGNMSTETRAVVVEDATSPTGTLTYSTTEPTNGSVTATLTTNDASKVTITNNEGSRKHTFTSNGSFTFEFEDAAGNTGSKKASVSWIDTTAPVVTIAASPSAADGERGWYITSPTIILSSNEIGEIYYTLESGGTENLYSQAVALHDGTKTITAWAVDRVGNIGDSLTATYKVDKAAPVVTLANDLAERFTNQTFAISGSISDASPIAYYEIYRGDAKVKTVANPESDFTDSIILSRGSNEIIVMAYDAAGNSSRAAHTVTYTAPSGGSSAAIKEAVTTEEAVAFEGSFTDVDGHWAADAIRLMEERGIAKGMTETEFAPEGTITRAQFATLLVRVLGLELAGEADTFADVATGAWYRNYVIAAYRSGLVNGMGDRSFAPEANITREQMAVMIMRALKALENSDFSNIATDMGQRFADQSGIAVWALRSVLIANDMGIINGMTEDTFAPAENATRAQAIVMLMRLLQSTGEI